MTASNDTFPVHFMRKSLPFLSLDSELVTLVLESWVVALALGAGLIFYYVATYRSVEKLPPGAQRLPHVWSLVPYVGSALAMGAGISEFIRKSSKKFHNAPFFTATILGDKCVFFADARYLHSVIFKAKYRKYLDTESLQKQFVGRVLGMNHVEEVYNKDVLALGISQYHHYLSSGPELSSNMGKVQAFFQDLIPTLADSRTGEWTRHHLFQMVFNAIFKASVGPLLSGAVVNDEALAAFREFDKGVIMMFNGVPGVFTRGSVNARATLLHQLQSEEYWSKASRLMQTRRKTLNVSTDTLDKANLGVLWASVGNSAPAVFWILHRLMEDEVAWQACQKQVQEVTESRESAVYSLEDLDKLTLLDSAFHETLRVYQCNFSGRNVKQGFVVETESGNYYIEKGTKLMPFWGILHSDEYVFENPKEWKYDRFAEKNKTYTYQDGTKLSYFPVVAFGGGGHLCPGRKFISYEVRLFMAMLMQSFEMRLAEGETRPGTDPAMQGIGVSQPLHDPKIEIRLRQDNQ